MKRQQSIVGAGAMIVEDEIDLSYLLSIVLKRNNLKPSCVHSITEASARIKSIKPSLVFLDNRLPDGYGSDFIPTVKRINPSAAIVMITACDSQRDVDIALNLGADYFITKPFTAQKIAATIQVIESNRA